MKLQNRAVTSRRFPPWLVKRVRHCASFDATRAVVDELGLSTVCRSAHCPNVSECFSEGTATFMILGEVCTRDCAFCAVAHGKAANVDHTEPQRLAEAVRRMGLSHAVVTSVTRDDLPDGGAGAFAETIRAVRRRSTATIEVLIPDFQGSADALETVLDAHPDVLNHNVETVRRLYASVRPQADYEQSLEVIRRARAHTRSVVTKSGIMVGLSETRSELGEAFRDLADAGCQVLTLGQYLAPTLAHHPVARYVTPEEFDGLREEALGAGLNEVSAGPFVRSSYHAGETLSRMQVESERISASDGQEEH